MNSFTERQPDYIRNDYTLCKALERGSQSGLTATIKVKQGSNDPPQQFYYRHLEAYFSSRNEPGMEDYLDLKSLFIQNLHPFTSHYFGHHHFISFWQTLTSPRFSNCMNGLR